MGDASLNESIQKVYDLIARRRPDHAFLNYGFDDPATPAGEATLDEMVAACQRLYEAVLLPFPEAAGRVVEVGCGRGGGAQVLLERHPHLHYTGLDLSSEHLALTRRRLAPRFRAQVAMADAAHLPLPAGSVDAAFSVEAVQHFGDPERFYREVARVVRPGGWFFLASLWRPRQEPLASFEASGFRVIERCDITPNVLTSLARTSALREELIDSLDLPERYRANMMSFAGARGFASYDGLASGAYQYLRYRLARV